MSPQRPNANGVVCASVGVARPTVTVTATAPPSRRAQAAPVHAWNRIRIGWSPLVVAVREDDRDLPHARRRAKIMARKRTRRHVPRPAAPARAQRVEADVPVPRLDLVARATDAVFGGAEALTVGVLHLANRLVTT